MKFNSLIPFFLAITIVLANRPVKHRRLSCVDKAKNCAQIKAHNLCNSPAHKHDAHLCSRSCGFCKTRKVRAGPTGTTGGQTTNTTQNGTNDCKDMSLNCIDWNRNGYCQSKYYSDAEKRTCAMTCKLCSQTTTPASFPQNSTSGCIDVSSRSVDTKRAN
ncbi:ShTK domain protein [Aphelenchoides besseyi]|nr:ShTK domain protein [Aphelenchoides besseyi]KAI6193805.1 ShTK domain protein [Aphelenchoides besseyi]